jgi:nucleoside-diphosphate-sugar epimerase
MKVLIIGGNRFFGKKLAQILIAEGHDLTMLNRGSIEDGLSSHLKRIKCDRTNFNDLQSAVGSESWDLVYDQVCFTGQEAKEALEIFKGKVGHYIFTSSQSVYGPDQNISESTFDPTTYEFEEMVPKAGHYAEAKRQSEAVFFRDGDFPVTAVRFPIVLGADDYTGRFAFHVNRILNGQEIYMVNPQAKISFISSDDAAMVLRFLGEQKAVGPINACSEKPIVLKDFITLLESELGKSAVMVDAPTEENTSPYGIDSDWFMNIEKLKALDCLPAPIETWLSREIQGAIDNES